jgi:hypothetical protein
MTNNKGKNPVPSIALSLVALCAMALTGCSSTPEKVGEQTQQMGNEDKLVSTQVVARQVPQAGQATVDADLVKTYRHEAFMQATKEYPIKTPVSATLLARQNGWFCMAENQEWKFTAGNLNADQITVKPTSVVADTSGLPAEDKAALNPKADPVVGFKLVTDQQTAPGKDGDKIDASIERTREHAFTYDNVDYPVRDGDKQFAEFVARQNGWLDIIDGTVYKFEPGNQVADKIARPVVEETAPRTEKVDASDVPDADPKPFAGAISPDGQNRNLVLRPMLSNTTMFKFETVHYPLAPDTIVPCTMVPEQNCWDRWVSSKLYRIHNDDARTIDVLTEKPTVTDNTDHRQLMPGGDNKQISGETFMGGPIVSPEGRRNLIDRQMWENSQEFQFLDYPVVSEVQTDWVPAIGNSCIQYRGNIFRIFGDGTVEQRTMPIPVDVTGTSYQPLSNFGAVELEPDMIGLPIVTGDLVTQVVQRSFEMPMPPYLLAQWHTLGTETFLFDESQEGYVFVDNGYTLVIPLPGSTIQRTGKVKVVQTPEGIRLPRQIYHKGNDGTSEGHTLKVPNPNDDRGDSVNRLPVPRKKHTDSGYGSSSFSDSAGSSGYQQGGSANTFGTSGYTQERQSSGGSRHKHESPAYSQPSGYTQPAQPSGYGQSSGYTQSTQSSGYGEGGSSNSFGESGYGGGSSSSGSSAGGHHHRHH